MAILSSLIVRLAVESAEFQRGLRSAQTELRNFERESGRLKSVGRDFRDTAQGADALARGLGVVHPQLGEIATTAVLATAAVKGLAGVFTAVLSPIGLAVGAGIILGGAINAIAGNAIAAIPIIDNLGTVLAGTSAKMVNREAKQQTEAMTGAFAKQTREAEELAHAVEVIAAKTATIQAVRPLDLRIGAAELAGQQLSALALQSERSRILIERELQERLLAAEAPGKKQQEVEALRVQAVADANAAIERLDQETTARRLDLMNSLIASARTWAESLGLTDVAEKLRLEETVESARRGLAAINDLFQAGKLSAQDYADAVDAVEHQLGEMGASAQQEAQALGSVKQEFDRLQQAQLDYNRQLNNLRTDTQAYEDALTGHSLDDSLGAVGEAAQRTGIIIDANASQFRQAQEIVDRYTEALMEATGPEFERLFAARERAQLAAVDIGLLSVGRPAPARDLADAVSEGVSRALAQDRPEALAPGFTGVLPGKEGTGAGRGPVSVPIPGAGGGDGFAAFIGSLGALLTYRRPAGLGGPAPELFTDLSRLAGIYRQAMGGGEAGPGLAALAPLGVFAPSRPTPMGAVSRVLASSEDAASRRAAAGSITVNVHVEGSVVAEKDLATAIARHVATGIRRRTITGTFGTGTDPMT